MSLAWFLSIVERAIQNPTDRAAAQIAIDGLAAAKVAGALPEVKKLVADIGTYVATLPEEERPAPIAPAEPPYVAPAHQSPTDFNLHQGDQP